MTKNRSKETETVTKQEMRLIQVPIENLVIDESFNARSDYSQVNNLAKDIAENGLMNPLQVQAMGNNQYFLLAGFCRAMSCKKLGWSHIPCFVVSPENDVERYFINIRENLARKQLTTYDIATRIVFLKENHQLSDKDISKKLQGSIDIGYKHINNLRIARESLDHDILEQWRNGHPMATTMRLFALAKYKDLEEQKGKWLEICAAGLNVDIAEDSKKAALAAYDVELANKLYQERTRAPRPPKGEGQAEDKDAKPKSKPINKDLLKKITEILVEPIEGVDDTARVNSRNILQWVLATAENPDLGFTVAGVLVYDPVAEKEAKAKVKAAGKEKSKTEKELALSQKREAEYARKVQEQAELLRVEREKREEMEQRLAELAAKIG